jgi:exopolysaccharide production protein ExoY
VDTQDDAHASHRKHSNKSRVLTEAKPLLLWALGAQLARMCASDEQRHQPLGGRAKRAFDVTLASVILTFAAPIMLVAMVLIRIFMGGPAFSAEPRIGFKGKAFSCYRFRTLARERQGTRKHLDDPRIEFLGYVFRKSGLNQLPQLFNVLRGDMSVVGPRQIGSDEIGHYGSGTRWYLKARPGLTGIWRARGRNNSASRVACDRYYASRWSLWLDLVLLIGTVAEVLKFNDPA